MKNLIFKSLDITPNQFSDLMVALTNFSYDAKNGEGVQVIEAHSDYARCVYCYETISSQNTYNPDTGDFDKLEFKRIELVPFVIDLQYKTLDILGKKQKCARVVEAVGKMTKYKIPISDILVNPIKILLSCTQSEIPYYVSRVKITDYVFFENIVGNCVLNLTDYTKTDELLKKFETQIVNFSVILTLDANYSMTFYKSGAISLYKDFEDLDIELIRTLKKGL